MICLLSKEEQDVFAGNGCNASPTLTISSSSGAWMGSSSGTRGSTEEGVPPGFPGMSTLACWRCYLALPPARSTRAARRAEQRLTCVSHVAPAATSAGTASVTSPLPTSPHLQPLAQFQSGPGQLATGWESQRSCPSPASPISNVNRLQPA